MASVTRFPRAGALLAIVFAVFASVLIPIDGAHAAVDAPTAEAQIYSGVNAERKALALPALLPSAKLDKAAQDWADHMAATGVMEHNPDTIGDMGGWAYGWMGYGENIAYGYPDGVSVMSAWMNSPGHKANILQRSFDRIGIGVAYRGSTPYYVQVFGDAASGDAMKTAQLYGYRFPALAGATPTVVGTAKVGVKLTARPGTWTAGTVFRYQWLRDGAAISGATSSTYTPVGADAGRRVAVRVTGSKSGWSPVSKTSAAAVVAKGTLGPVVPVISGSARPGQTLTAKPGAWSPAPVTLRYQWLRNGIAITGATRATYAVVGGDVAKRITVRVTGSKTGYVSVSRTAVAVLVAG